VSVCVCVCVCVWGGGGGVSIDTLQENFVQIVIKDIIYCVVLFIVILWL
jgi:hypothetical protein